MPTARINIAPSTLIALAMVMSLSSVTATSSAMTTASLEPARLVRPESDREQVAHLLACLTEAARELHGRGGNQAIPAGPTVWSHPLARILHLSSFICRPQAEQARRLPPLSPGHPHLTDLPPPQV